jgi:hypothetical protein
MRIPDVADELRELAVKHGIPRLSQLADELGRRQLATRAPISSNKMTEKLAEKIRKFARRHPNMSQLDVGVHFGVNQGRVSEALYGKRK